MKQNKQMEELKVKLHNTLYSEGVEVSMSIDKAISEFVDLEVSSLISQTKKELDWWGDYKDTHAHTINGEYFIGEISRSECKECIKRWGKLQ